MKDALNLSSDSPFNVTVRSIVDVGESNTKIVFDYSVDGSCLPLQFLTQPSGILPLGAGLYDSSLDLADNNTALIRMPEGDCWIVGEQAGVSPADTKVDKSKTAAVKLIASVGQMLAKIPECNQGTITLDVAVLLPISESKTFGTLAKTISDGLYGAQFNGRSLDLVLPKLAGVFPEGSGLASLIVENSVLILFGQKDVSVVPVRSGSLAGESACFVGWGMVRLLKDFPVPVTDEIRTAHAVFKYCVKQNDSGIRDIFRHRADLVLEKFPSILENYWLQLSHKLSSFAAIADADKIYLGGGNAPMMSPLAAKFFGKKCESKTLIEPVNRHFKAMAKSPMAYRLSDPLTLHIDLWGCN